MIDAENNTLAGIAAAINDSAASAKVLATVITGSGAARLTITARSSGAANAITITQSGGDGGLAALVYPPSGAGLTQLPAALDARALIDGMRGHEQHEHDHAARSPASTSRSLPSTTTARRRKSPSGTTARPHARRSTSFVKSYNALVDAIKSVASYNTETQ